MHQWTWESLKLQSRFCSTSERCSNEHILKLDFRMVRTQDPESHSNYELQVSACSGPGTQMVLQRGHAQNLELHLFRERNHWIWACTNDSNDLWMLNKHIVVQSGEITFIWWLVAIHRLDNRVLRKKSTNHNQIWQCS